MEKLLKLRMETYKDLVEEVKGKKLENCVLESCCMRDEGLCPQTQ